MTLKETTYILFKLRLEFNNIYLEENAIGIMFDEIYKAGIVDGRCEQQQENLKKFDNWTKTNQIKC